MFFFLYEYREVHTLDGVNAKNKGRNLRPHILFGGEDFYPVAVRVFYEIDAHVVVFEADYP